MRNMIFYKNRRRLENKYLEWSIKQNAVMSPFNLISFLVGYGLLNKRKVIKFLKEKK